MPLFEYIVLHRVAGRRRMFGVGGSFEEGICAGVTDPGGLCGADVARSGGEKGKTAEGI